MINGALPDVVVTEEDFIPGDDKIVERRPAIATDKRSLMGRESDESTCPLDRDSYLPFAGWKIREQWAEMASMESLQQIGGLRHPE